MPIQKIESSESIIPRKPGLPPGEGPEKGLITLPGEAEPVECTGQEEEGTGVLRACREKGASV